MSETTGFRIVIRDCSHTLRISNTEKTGFVTFRDSDSKEGIDLSEERFVDFVKYLDIEVKKIKEKIKAKKPEADFKIENPEEKKIVRAKKQKKVLENSGNIISVPKKPAEEN